MPENGKHLRGHKAVSSDIIRRSVLAYFGVPREKLLHVCALGLVRRKERAIIECHIGTDYALCTEAHYVEWNSCSLRKSFFLVSRVSWPPTQRARDVVGLEFIRTFVLVSIIYADVGVTGRERSDPLDYRGGFGLRMAAQHEHSHADTAHPALPQELSGCAIFCLCCCLRTKKRRVKQFPCIDRIYCDSHLELRFLHYFLRLLWLVALHD